MTRKEQNKILDDKIESNINQYKVDRLNVEISAFSSGDLNKYDFLNRKDLKYKPNASDKAKFEFSPLGKAFSVGLDKTVQGYQEESVIKLLKDIRDGLAGGNRRDDGNDEDGRNDEDGGNDEGGGNDKIYNMLNKFKDNMNNFDKEVKDKEHNLKAKLDKLDKLNNNVKKLDNYFKENNNKKTNTKKELDDAKTNTINYR